MAQRTGRRQTQLISAQNKQCFAPNLLYLKLTKHNQRNWSRFKQTLDKSSHKPTISYTIDWCKIQLDWCCDANGRVEARAILSPANIQCMSQVVAYVTGDLFYLSSSVFNIATKN